MHLKASLFCIFILLLHLRVTAQHVLKIEGLNAEERKVLGPLNFQNQEFDSLASLAVVNEIIIRLQENGYLLASSKSISSSGTTIAYISAGEVYKLVRLSTSKIDESWLNRTGRRKNLLVDRPFRYQQLVSLKKQLLEQAENSGYPFAAIGFDSVEIKGNVLEAGLMMEKGPFIIFDTLEVSGNAKISKRFLASHLGIRYGDAYDQRKVKEAESLLRALPYIRLRAEPKVSFQNRQGTLWLDLAQKRANIIDGVIGLLPDPQEGGKLMFTGQFDLLLFNPFGTGKKIELHWQRLNQQSQNLEVGYFHPYLFGSKVSLDADFSLLKEEEQFVNRQMEGELQIRQGANSTIRLLVSQKDSRLLAKVRENDFASFNINQAGIGLNIQKLDDPQLPQSGYDFTIDITGGKKNIRDLPAVIDSLATPLSTSVMQYRAMGRFRYFKPLGGQLVWAQSLLGGFLADDQLFLNDMFRLGGLSSLRGFREKSFFASDYILSRTEIRYLAGAETWLFAFYDQSWMVQKQGNLHLTDWPLGCGAGLSLGTSSGTFNFVYAVGQSKFQPMNFAHSQVHFGYVNRF